MDTCLIRCNRYTTGRCDLIRDNHFALNFPDLLSDPFNPPNFNQPVLKIVDDCMVKEFVSGEVEIQTSDENESPHTVTSSTGIPDSLVFDFPTNIGSTPENSDGQWMFKFKVDLILLGGVNCSYEIIFKRNSPFS